MNTKHLPGPYFSEPVLALSHAERGQKVVLIGSDGTGKRIAEVYVTDVQAALATARLFAAAPEMYEALKSLDEACCENLGEYEGRQTLRKALITARAAIQKAEGGK